MAPSPRGFGTCASYHNLLVSQHTDTSRKSWKHSTGSRRTKLAGLFPITAAHANFTTLLYFTKGVAVFIRLYRYHRGPVQPRAVRAVYGVAPRSWKGAIGIQYILRRHQLVKCKWPGVALLLRSNFTQFSERLRVQRQSIWYLQNVHSLQWAPHHWCSIICGWKKIVPWSGSCKMESPETQHSSQGREAGLKLVGWSFSQYETSTGC